MKQARRILALLQAILLLAGMALSVHAASEITPYYNNTLTASMTPAVSDDGLLSVKLSFRGFEGETEKAVITTYVEKKVLGLFWSRVDIGETDNEWVNIVYGAYYTNTRTVQLSSTGTYRVTTTFVVTGTGGAADEIVYTEQVTY